MRAPSKAGLVAAITQQRVRNYDIDEEMVGRSAAVWSGMLALGLALGCGPKATLTQATPIASLETYGSVLIRVGFNQGVPGTQNQVAALEYMTADRLRRACRFNQVLLASQQPQARTDLIMDMNIQQLFFGADPNQGGLIKFHNSSQATADVAVILSDGINDELVGSAQIRGRSAAVTTASPEAQAITVVADKVAEIMKTSGCHLDRVARAPEPPPQTTTTAVGQTGTGEQTGEGSGSEGGEEKGQRQETIDQAEALNDEGKTLFRQANAAGASAKFQAAIDLIADPRYYFNLCLAREAEGKFDAALTACQQIKSMGGDERLVAKATERVEIIKSKRGK